MKKTIEKQNEEALLNAFKIEELEERLEMAPWNTSNGCKTNGGGPADCNQPGGGTGMG